MGSVDTPASEVAMPASNLERDNQPSLSNAAQSSSDLPQKPAQMSLPLLSPPPVERSNEGNELRQMKDDAVNSVDTLPPAEASGKPEDVLQTQREDGEITSSREASVADDVGLKDTENSAIPVLAGIKRPATEELDGGPTKRPTILKSFSTARDLEPMAPDEPRDETQLLIDGLKQLDSVLTTQIQALTPSNSLIMSSFNAKELRDFITSDALTMEWIQKEKDAVAEEAKKEANRHYIKSLEKVKSQLQHSYAESKKDNQRKIEELQDAHKQQMDYAVAKVKKDMEIEKAKMSEQIQEKHRQNFMRLQKDHQQEIKELQINFKNSETRILTNAEIARFLSTEPESRKLFKSLASEELVKYRLKLKSQYQAILKEIAEETGRKVVSRELYNYTAEMPKVADYSGPVHDMRSSKRLERRSEGERKVTEYLMGMEPVKPAKPNQPPRTPPLAEKSTDSLPNVIDLTETPTRNLATGNNGTDHYRAAEIRSMLQQKAENTPPSVSERLPPTKPAAMLSPNARAVRLTAAKAKRYDELVVSGVILDKKGAQGIVRTNTQKASLFDRLVVAKVAQPIVL